MIAKILFSLVVSLVLVSAASALGAPGGGSVGPPSMLRRSSSEPCSKATAKYGAAKRSLQKLEAAGASRTALHRARRKVQSAARAITKICSALFDVTGVSGTFDVTVTAQDHDDSCMTTMDAHWTAGLGSGAEPAQLNVFSLDRHGRPEYAFHAEIPIREHGTGTATVTCNDSPPASNGTATCSFDLSPIETISIGTETGGSLDPQKLGWVFGYNSFAYSRSVNGGACSYSGARPPIVEPTLDSPSLFVSTTNDGSNALEPPGVTTVPASAFAHSLNLEFSGSKSLSLDSSRDSSKLDASWQMTVSLKRR